MKNEYRCDLNDLLELFTDHLSASDLLASKTLGEVSAAIVKRRVELGMTQKQFAQHMDVSQGMVSKWESSDYNFSIKTLAEIAAKVDMDLEVRLHKAKTISVSEEPKKINKITSIENQFLIVNDRNARKKMSNCFKRYVDDSDTLKVMVK